MQPGGKRCHAGPKLTDRASALGDLGPQALSDDEFHAAHVVILHHERHSAEQVHAAATRMIKIATQKGDRLMWSFIFARIAEFIDRGDCPPMPLLKGVSEAFTRFRGGLKSLDEAFGLKRATRGRPVTWSDRERARTRAEVVADFITRGDTLEVAIWRAASLSILGDVSESQIKRDYLKYRRLK